MTTAAAAVSTPAPTTTPAPAADTQAPTAPAGLSGRFSSGVLVLTWQASTDNVGVDHYELYLNGNALERIPGVAATATTRAFDPSGAGVYTVRAFDAAGNQSAVLTSVTVEPVSRPTSVPRRIPDWAWKLFAWQEHHKGKQPKHPKPLPHWYAAWKAWRVAPFKLAG